MYKNKATTPNVRNAKERKRRNREARAIADAAEAKQLGIAVRDLVFKRSQEVKAILDRRKENERLAQMPRVQSVKPHPTHGILAWLHQ